MSDMPPVIGQDPWGDDLNAYLAQLQTMVDSLLINQGSMGGELQLLQTQIDGLNTRVANLEARPEYIVNSYSWQYSNAAPPPTGSQVRFDNADLSLATQAIFRLIDNDGADRTAVFQQLAAGSMLRINDWNDAANIHRFNVTGPASIAATDVTIPVAWISGAGTIPNAKANVAFIVALEVS